MLDIRRSPRLLVYAVLLFLPVLLFSRDFSSDYIYYKDDDIFVPVPRAYESVSIIRYVGEEYGDFHEAQDLFIDSHDMLYLADTNNNRILKLTPDGEVVQVFLGDERGFNRPHGLFVDPFGDIFVADTENSRVVHLDGEGRFIEEFGEPRSGILGEYFTYYPSKISLSPTGLMYVIKGKSILTLDSYNNFRGYLGQSRIGFNFDSWLISMVATQEQKERIRNRSAPPFTNMYVDGDGIIYATSLDLLNGEIKKLNATGANIYKEQSYGLTLRNRGEMITPEFVDITVSSQGIITALERNGRLLYQYDQEGNLLAIFGGEGTAKGKFILPTSISLDSKRRIFVLDAATIQILAPTRFIQTVHNAIEMYSEGFYDDALVLWREVQQIDENYRLAASGIAKALHKKGLWDEALAQYKGANDKAGYSRTYVEYRHERFRRYFTVVVLVLVVVAIILFRVITLYYRVSEKALDAAVRDKRRINLLRLPLAITFKPATVIRLIPQYRENFSFLPVVVLLLLTIAVRVVSIFLTHFPLAVLDPRDANIFLEMVKILVPLFTWTISVTAVTSIMDGEAVYKEILLATCYALVPYILLTLPAVGLTRFLSSVKSEKNIYEFINNVIWIWMLMLMFSTVVNLHDYHIGKAIAVCVLSLFGIALIWSLFVLMYALTGNLKAFVQGLAIEAWMTIRYR